MSAIGRRVQRAAEAAHALADIEEERLALLLAVVADIDAGGDLLAHHVARRRLAQRVELRFVDRLARARGAHKRGQSRRTRQAAGMRGQDAVRLVSIGFALIRRIACSNTAV